MTEFGRREVLVHVRRGNEFLVLRRTDHGYWHPVAGGAEPGESWEEAALRELREETGLDASAVAEVGAFEYTREAWEAEAGMRAEVRGFVVDASEQWEPTLDREHDDYRWCGLDDACALLYWPEPRELLRSL